MIQKEFMLRGFFDLGGARGVSGSVWEIHAQQKSLFFQTLGGNFAPRVAQESPEDAPGHEKSAQRVPEEHPKRGGNCKKSDFRDILILNNPTKICLDFNAGGPGAKQKNNKKSKWKTMRTRSLKKTIKKQIEREK